MAHSQNRPKCFQCQRWIPAQSKALLEEGIVPVGVQLHRFLQLELLVRLVIKLCMSEDMSHWWAVALVRVQPHPLLELEISCN